MASKPCSELAVPIPTQRSARQQDSSAALQVLRSHRVVSRLFFHGSLRIHNKTKIKFSPPDADKAVEGISIMYRIKDELKKVRG